jgi:hypothetical protein
VEAPAWLCERVFEIAPYARLAWAGEVSKDPKELNPGGYAIVELARSSEVGSLDEPRIPQEIWHVTTRANNHGQVVRRRIDRGPIFNRRGGTSPDWDLLGLVPVFVARPKDYGLDDRAFYHGAVIPLLQRWTTSVKDRQRKDQEKRAKEVKQQLDDISRDGTERLWSMAQKSDATDIRTTTREERIKEHARLLRQRADFEGYFKGKSRY